MPGGLQGRVALVSGAGAPRGIGRAISLGMAREGARIAAADETRRVGLPPRGRAYP